MMSISNDPYFTGAVKELYQPTKEWTLSQGNGIKTVYVNFYNQYDTFVSVQNSITLLDTSTQSGFSTSTQTNSSTEQALRFDSGQATQPPSVSSGQTLSPTARAALVQQLKTQIAEIQKQIVILITQLVQLLQEQLKSAGR